MKVKRMSEEVRKGSLKKTTIRKVMKCYVYCLNNIKQHEKEEEHS